MCGCALPLLAMHPVAALMEFCNRRRLMHPIYELVEDDGPAHRKTFRYKVFVVIYKKLLFLLKLFLACVMFLKIIPSQSHL